VRIIYPGMVPVARELWDLGPPGLSPLGRRWKAARREVWRDHERDGVWVAPRWLAWLYRWLPYSVTWHNAPEHRVPQPAAFFLWAITARRWQFAWLPASRRPEYGARFGILALGLRRLVL